MLFDRLFFRVPYEVAERHAHDLFRRHNLVAVDPALVDAVRSARDDDAPGRFDIGGGVSSRDHAKLALADAVLAQLGAKP